MAAEMATGNGGEQPGSAYATPDSGYATPTGESDQAPTPQVRNPNVSTLISFPPFPLFSPLPSPYFRKSLSQ